MTIKIQFESNTTFSTSSGGIDGRIVFRIHQQQQTERKLKRELFCKSTSLCKYFFSLLKFVVTLHMFGHFLYVKRKMAIFIMASYPFHM